MRRLGKRLAIAAAGLACLAAAAAQAPYAPPPVPADNPQTPAKVELGRRLFYDADLSIDGTMACATCHEQRRGFTDGNTSHPGVHGETARRNVPSLADVGDLSPLTWADPSLKTLETQFNVPLMGEHPVEMGMAGQAKMLTDRLSAEPCYRRMFAAAFPGDGTITVARIGQAIAAFERTLVSHETPYDHDRRGETAALSDAARRGESLFFGPRLDCAACHAGPNFTDTAFHDIGLYDLDGAGGYPASDHGLREVTGRAADEGRFRTPGLRNVALSAPYMHDGSIADLGEAVRAHYRGTNPLRDPALAGRSVSGAEVADLKAFLGALTDQDFVSDLRFSLPKRACPA
ncbi:MAG: cytochrome c peroxidase [Caulobacteraceae bacterium]|nr:cytochrome c peroxidase [Caulobacteraceae bacterium]